MVLKIISIQKSATFLSLSQGTEHPSTRATCRARLGSLDVQLGFTLNC